MNVSSPPQLPAPTAERPRRSPWLWTALSALGGLAVLALFLAWMGGAFRPKVPPGEVPVERLSAAGRVVVPVERWHGEETVAAVGSVQPRRKADVASQLLASILEVRVQPGDRVQAGDLLVVLDDRELLAQQREATAAVGAAEADLTLRRQDLDRAKKLVATRAIGQEDYDRIASAAAVARAQLARSKEQVARIEVQIGYTRIKAATAGVIADRYADPGDLAVPGKALLTLQEPGVLELHAAVPESLALRLGLGQKLPLRVDAAGLAGQGTVREIVPLAQQATRSVLVKVSLPPDQSAPVYAGMFGRVSIPVGEADRLLLPAAAVQRVGQLELVDVVGRDGRLERRFVRTGRDYDGKVEILSGLAEGERVALPGR